MVKLYQDHEGSVTTITSGSQRVEAGALLNTSASRSGPSTSIHNAAGCLWPAPVISVDKTPPPFRRSCLDLGPSRSSKEIGASLPSKSSKSAGGGLNTCWAADEEVAGDGGASAPRISGTGSFQDGALWPGRIKSPLTCNPCLCELGSQPVGRCSAESAPTCGLSHSTSTKERPRLLYTRTTLAR